MDQGKIGKFISELRKSKGMTQMQLGDAVGVSYKAVSKWECGTTSPDISLFPDLAKVLGVTTDELFDAKINPNKLKYKRWKFIKKILVFIIIILIIISLVLSFLLFRKNDFTYELYRISSADENYYIDGSIFLTDKEVILNIYDFRFDNLKNIYKNYNIYIKNNSELIFTSDLFSEYDTNFLFHVNCLKKQCLDINNSELEFVIGFNIDYSDYFEISIPLTIK